MMRATTTEEYGSLLRWSHVPASVLVVSLVWFVRVYLRAGRSWLAWTICSLRIFALALNFVFTPNLNFHEIIRLRPIFLWSETVALPVGVTNRWTLIGQFSSLLLLVFVVDAAIVAWRRGDGRRALAMGGTLSLAIIVAAGQAALLVWGILPMPYVLSLAFLTLILVMGYELSRDVLRAAQLSRELRESEERMSLAATAADLGLWEWDIVRDEIWATDKVRTRLGLAKSEHIDFNCFLQSLHPDDREHVAHGLAKAMNGDGDYESEYRVMLPDGEVRWVVAAGRVEFDAGHKPVRMRGISRDITRRKQMEQQLQQQRNELAHVARVSEVGQLAVSLAHELNQPLGAIMRNAEAAEMFLQHPSPDLDEVRAILEDIRKDDQRAGGVIDRMRALMKKGTVEYRLFDLNVLAGETVTLVRPDAEMRRVRMVLETDPALSPVHGDQVQLQQVLLNLLLNAMDALNDNPPANRVVTVRTRSAGAAVEVTVSDTGPGIPADRLQRVFEPFFSSKSNGLGMGLAISRTIVEAHGGRLWAENRAAAGATFTFTLPVVKGGNAK